MDQLMRQDAAAELAIQTVLDSLDSLHSRRAYERHLREFIAWHRASEHVAINKAIVQRYVAHMREAGRSPATINQKLSAIRKLAIEAADNGALNGQIANGIKAVKGVRREGTRTGNWLTKQQAQKLLNAPDSDTLKGLRDRAIFAVLIGCGLRRAEAVNLTLNHIQQRDGRWVLLDLIGKRNKVRSVPMPNWAKQAIDEYVSAADLTGRVVFRSVNRGGHMTRERMRMTEQAIYNVVIEYAENWDSGRSHRMICVELLPS